VYGPSELKALAWHEAASVAFGFFQMAGFNRYEDHVGGSGVVPFTTILKSLDSGKRSPFGGAASGRPDDEARTHTRLFGLTRHHTTKPTTTTTTLGWHPAGPLLASRELQRPPFGLPANSVVKATAKPIEAILGPARKPSTMSLQADMPLEYLPFAVGAPLV
jgi:hypothetical protein